MPEIKNLVENDSSKISHEQVYILQKNIKAVTSLDTHYGKTIKYPLEEEGPRGFLKEIELVNGNQVIRFGKNFLTERNGANTDFYVHIFNKNKNIRFIHFLDGNVLIKETDQNDEELYSIEKPLDELTLSQFYLENSVLDLLLRAKLS